MTLISYLDNSCNQSPKLDISIYILPVLTLKKQLLEMKNMFKENHYQIWFQEVIFIMLMFKSHVTYSYQHIDTDRHIAFSQ